MISFESPDTFLPENLSRFPNLDPDFILQVCFEHPGRFDELLPEFDARLHSARRVPRTAGWVYENVRYENNEDVDFWFDHFDSQLASGQSQYEMFTHMIKHGTWPFPPVIVEAGFAVTIGAPKRIGYPYHLIEGTHRISYLRRMIQRGLVPHEKLVEVIEVMK